MKVFERVPAPLFSTNRHTYTQDFVRSQQQITTLHHNNILSLTIFPLHFVLLTMKLSLRTWLDILKYCVPCLVYEYSKVFQSCLNSNCLNSVYSDGNTDGWFQLKNDIGNDKKWKAHRTNCNAIILTLSVDNQMTPHFLMYTMKSTVFTNEILFMQNNAWIMIFKIWNIIVSWKWDK